MKMNNPKVIAIYRAGLWYLSPDTPHTDAVGSNIAGNNTIRSFISSGHWDEIHFVLAGHPSHSSSKKALNYLNSLITSNVKCHLKVITWGEFLNNYGNNLYKCVYYSYLSMLKFQYFLRSTYPNVDTIFLLHAHGTNADSMQYDFLHNIIYPLRDNDALICSSMQVRKFFEKKFLSLEKILNKITGLNFSFNAQMPIIPFGVDIDKYKRRNKNELRNELELPLNKIIILWMGRLSIHNKSDLYPILLILHKINDRFENLPQYKFVIAGTNKEGYGEELARQIRVSKFNIDIEFKFNVSDLAQRMLYSASDIFIAVSDSLSESFGISLLEAMASGLLVIASNWDGYKDIIIDNYNGFLIDTYWADCVDDINHQSTISDSTLNLRMNSTIALNLNQLQDRLILLINDSKKRKEFGDNGIEHIKRNYTRTVVSKQIHDLIDELYEKKYKIPIKTEIEEVFQQLLNRNYFLEYEHYPSIILKENDQIFITEFGNNIVKDLDIFIQIFPSSLCEFYNLLVIKDIVESITVNSISYIQQYMFHNFNISKSESLRHILWMVKYGFAELQNP